jgi:protein TonB
MSSTASLRHIGYLTSPADLSAVQRGVLAVSVVLAHVAAAAAVWQAQAHVVEEPLEQPAIMVSLVTQDAPVPAPKVTPTPPAPTPAAPVKVQPVTQPEPRVVAAAARPNQVADVPVVTPAQVVDKLQPTAPVQPAVNPSPPSSNIASADTPKQAPQPKVLPSSAVRYLVPPVLNYPRASHELGESGVVRLRVLVDETGRIKDIEVTGSSGYARLDQAAVASMRNSRFQPHLEDGVPCAVWVVAPVKFKIEEQ